MSIKKIDETSFCVDSNSAYENIDFKSIEKNLTVIESNK